MLQIKSNYKLFLKQLPVHTVMGKFEQREGINIEKNNYIQYVCMFIIRTSF